MAAGNLTNRAKHPQERASSFHPFTLQVQFFSSLERAIRGTALHVNRPGHPDPVLPSHAWKQLSE
jgi:hypothetical protein